ncbi:hypothetical protein CA233_17785 [Sphingomonas sp. ABOLD]|uniref:Uncharacterized protein n=1 Tax=Sphingomonas trueperi TaxID=53317 RepID=A0A7X5XXD9_9SPHN|nr:MULTISPECIES: hypothetical protein [Sphingomonas]NJB97091.1 hypothetical protein [Sphingomonas trueperi]RSV38733.1 hypothetical protein CA234_15905 [Sphingomonas sp. ABOLE]RSV42090.1 hypothetical protein CA233_17785 [Sphingomonas sp. ABOLD]
MEDLRRHHAQMLAALDELEQLTRSARCDDKAVMAVRYRLTRASSARRREVVALCERLIAAGATDPALKALRDATNVSRGTSSSHIGTWTLRQVIADWPGYVRASNLMRAALRREVAREVAVLAPHFAQAM